MAAEQTDRLKVYTWSSDADDFTRQQMTASHQELEDRAAIFLEPSAALPSEAPADQTRSFHLVTSGTPVLYFTGDGENWTPLNSFAAPSGVVTPGSTNTQGVSSSIVRADHVHALPAWGSTTEPVGTSASAGEDVLFARADHVHVVGTGAINSASMLASNVVEASAIASSAVVTAKIQDAAVTAAKLAAGVGIPAGSIMAFGGTTKPTGWEWCDGAAYSSSNPSYTALFNAIGTNYGSGSGGNNFNVPNLNNNKFPRGGTPGATGGQDAVTLTQGNLPAHTHLLAGAGAGTTNSGSHAHVVTGFTSEEPAHDHGMPNVAYTFTGSNTGFWLQGSGGLQIKTTAFADELAHSHTLVAEASSGNSSHVHGLEGSTSSVGSGSSVETLPAYLGVRFIIKL
jgi:microcystin-dependent protein